MKRFVCIGCSNGQWFDDVFGQLLPDWEIHNLSDNGAGNHYITGRLIEWLHYHGQPDRVYLQYSGLNRVDIPADPGADDWGGYKWITRTKWHNWLHSGGHYSSWIRSDRVRPLMERRKLMLANNRWSLAMQNILPVVTALSVCDQLAIPVTWSTYYNWRQPPNEFVALSDGFIDRWPAWLSLDRMIQPDPFTWGERHGQTPEDMGHWSKAVFESWCLGPGRASWSHTVP
jgi:hypothetical protein